MAIVVTFRVPAATCAALIPGYGTAAVGTPEIKAAIKGIIDQALSTNAPPVVTEIPPTVQTERINLSLKDAEAVKVRAVAKAMGIPDSLACQRLVMGLAAAAPGPAGDTIPPGCELLAEAWDKTGKTPRLAQAQCFLNVRDAFSDGQVALVEAGTGIGKTLALLLAAEDRLRSLSDSRVVIAVPTIAIMRQFMSAHRSLVQAGFPIHRMEAIFGRREFVSRDALLEMVDHPRNVSHRPAILSWIGLLGEPMVDGVFDKPWLVSTLRQIAPAFPADACVLPDLPADDDPGYRAYLQQFEHTEREELEIVLCTHAMLAVSTKQRHWVASRSESYQELRSREAALMSEIKAETDANSKTALRQALINLQSERILYGAELSETAGKLPPFRYLLVDEAHLLEGSISSASASYLSIHSLLQKLAACHAQGLGITAARLANAKSAAERLKAAASHAPGDQVVLGSGSKAAVLIQEALTDLLDATALGRVRKKDLSAAELYLVRQLQYGAAILKSASVSAYNQQAGVRFSPVRDFPQLFIGSSRVDHLLSAIWGGVKAAACVSATLYVPKADGYSSNYQRRLLAIPDGRFKAYAPIVPLWTYSPVLGVAMPAEDDALCPPSRSDKLPPDALEVAEKRWLGEVARQVETIWASAAGGVLVLMTSYASIRKIADQLSPEMHRAAVFGTLDSSLFEQSAAFLTLCSAGMKPIWFATGGAWTGLDIGGHEPLQDILGQPPLPPVEDNILTDIVIPRMPFGINRSVTHEFRIRTDPAIPWEILDMLTRLKQGIGRLVRREGLPHTRRIFFLDARIHRKRFASTIRQRIEWLLKPYVKLAIGAQPPKR